MFEIIFNSTLSQLIVMILFIVAGFILKKTNVLKDGALGVLSKLVTYLFLPAVLVNSFMTQFTVDNLSLYGEVLLFSLVVSMVTIPLGLLLGKLLVKNDDFLKKIYQYGFIYSNFTYIGIPLIQAIAPEFEMHYLIFTIIPQFCFALWALPELLIPKAEETEEEKKTFSQSVVIYLKRLLTPIFIGLFIGIILGLTGLGQILPQFLTTTIKQASGCMSVTAMLLTGVVIASYNIKDILVDYKIYIASVLRLIAIPVVLGFLLKLIMIITGLESDYMMLILLVYTAMPLGLNTVIIPSAYGKETSSAAGMALVSHIIGIISMPLVIALMMLL